MGVLDTSTGAGGFAAQLMDFVNGLRGKYTNIGATAAGMADPFASQRGQYQQQLVGLMTDPNSFKMDPGSQFAMQQGQEAVARNGNAMFGTTRAGNTPIELEKYAAGFANQAYNTRINQLLTLSGATTGSPGDAAAQYVAGNKENDKSLALGLTGLSNLVSSLISSGIPAATANAIAKMLGLGGGSGDPATPPGIGDQPTPGGDQGGFPGDTGQGYTPDATTQPIDFSPDGSGYIVNGGGTDLPNMTIPDYTTMDPPIDFTNMPW